MSQPRLRVLGPRGARMAWLQPILSTLGPPIDPRDAGAAEENCEGLVVLDDCTDCESLRTALALRQANPDLQIAVVKLVDRSWTYAECLTRLVSEPCDGGHPRRRRISEQRLREVLQSRSTSLDVRIDPDAITFEYQD